MIKKKRKKLEKESAKNASGKSQKRSFESSFSKSGSSSGSPVLRPNASSAKKCETSGGLALTAIDNPWLQVQLEEQEAASYPPLERILLPNSNPLSSPVCQFVALAILS